MDKTARVFVTGHRGMAEADYVSAERDYLVKQAVYRAYDHHE